MPGQRPDTRIVLKPKKGEGTITLASFWTDGDRPSGGLDRRIKRLKLELEDGTIVMVVNTPKEAVTHYCNLYRDQPGTELEDGTIVHLAAADLGDDDIPF